MKYLYLLLLLPLCWACDTPADSTSSEGVSADTNSLAGRLQSLADAIKADPNNRELYLERAALFRSTAKWPQAMADLDRVLRLDTMDAEALALKGLYNLDQAKFNEAYDNYARCVQNDPEDVTCLLGQAEIELLLNKYSEAIELINRALRADEFAIKGYWLKGRYYKELEDTTLARSSYATVVEIDPTYADAYINWGCFGPRIALNFPRGTTALRSSTNPPLPTPCTIWPSSCKTKPEMTRLNFTKPWNFTPSLRRKIPWTPARTSTVDSFTWNTSSTTTRRRPTLGKQSSATDCTTNPTTTEACAWKA